MSRVGRVPTAAPLVGSPAHNDPMLLIQDPAEQHDLVVDRGSPESGDGAAGVVPLARFAGTQAAWGEEMGGRRPLTRHSHTETAQRGDPCCREASHTGTDCGHAGKSRRLVE